MVRLEDGKPGEGKCSSIRDPEKPLEPKPKNKKKKKKRDFNAPSPRKIHLMQTRSQPNPILPPAPTTPSSPTTIPLPNEPAPQPHYPHHPMAKKFSSVVIKEDELSFMSRYSLGLSDATTSNPIRR